MNLEHCGRPALPVIKHVSSFHDLLNVRFADGINAACWERRLTGAFGEIVALLGPGEGIVALDEERLNALPVTCNGRAAIAAMLSDLRLLRDAGRDPVLNIVYGYPRDEDAGPVATDVFSWHVDSAPIEADTWLCTYHGAPSEGLLNEHALRKVDDPAIRAQLLKVYGGSDDDSFHAWLTDNHCDLHYSAASGSKPYSFGRHNLWRISVAWPGNPNPCAHRAPVTNAPRLLLIS